MKLTKICLPNKEDIITKNNFFIDTIVPITIKEHINSFIIFFAANQKCDDKTIYLQMMVSPDSDIENQYFKYHFLLNNSSDLAKNMTSDSLYITDFCMDNMDKDMYFHSIAVKPIKSSDKMYASILNLFIPVSIFTRIQLYLDGMVNINTTSLTYSNELVFSDPLLNTISLINIEEVKLLASAKMQENLYVSHYMMKSGSTEFRMNYVSITSKNGLLKEPISYNPFMAVYERYYTLDDTKTFLFDGKLYIFFAKDIGIDDYKKSYLLCLDKELINRTNFIDSNYIFEGDNNGQ